MSFWATDFWAANFWAVDFWSNVEASYVESGDYGGISRSAEGVMGTAFLKDVELDDGTVVTVLKKPADPGTIALGSPWASPVPPRVPAVAG